MVCKICNKQNDLRFGVCFQCAEAESIIGDGLDMMDNGPDENDEPAKTPLEKLKFLVNKGWKKI
jgi:hypothetical protein